MTLKCSKACKDSFIFSVFKGCRRCFLLCFFFLLQQLALLRAVLLTWRKRESECGHIFIKTAATVNSIHEVIQGTGSNGVLKSAAVTLPLVFPLHYLSCVEEPTLKQLRGYSRFIKWDKIEHVCLIPTRSLLLQEYICCLGSVLGRLSAINGLINHPSKVKSELNLRRYHD